MATEFTPPPNDKYFFMLVFLFKCFILLYYKTVFIVCQGNKVYNSPFKGVSDTVLKNNSPFSPIVLRRFAVQFENLTPDQAAKLDYFLLNHTLGEA